MKRFCLLALVLIIVTGCGSASRARAVLVGFADFRPYTTEGFFVSPDPYPGKDFTPIGELSLEVRPAWNYSQNGSLSAETIGAAELLNTAVQEARKRGANGLVDYRVAKRYVTSSKGLTSLVDAYEVTGLLILVHEVSVE